MLGKKRVTLGEPPGLPSSHRRGGSSQSLICQPCQTDWDCPEQRLEAGCCGVVPGTLARPSVATAKGLNLGREAGW